MGYIKKFFSAIFGFVVGGIGMVGYIVASVFYPTYFQLKREDLSDYGPLMSIFIYIVGGLGFLALCLACGIVASLRLPFFGLHKGWNEGVMAALKAPIELWKDMWSSYSSSRSVVAPASVQAESNQHLQTRIQFLFESQPRNETNPLLTEDEITSYRAIIVNDVAQQQALSAYENYLNEKCSLSLSTVAELYLENSLVRADHGAEGVQEKLLAVYRKEDLDRHISTCTEQNKSAYVPTIPSRRLDDSSITLSRGLPEKIICFIQTVRAAIRNLFASVKPEQRDDAKQLLLPQSKSDVKSLREYRANFFSNLLNKNAAVSEQNLRGDSVVPSGSAQDYRTFSA